MAAVWADHSAGKSACCWAAWWAKRWAVVKATLTVDSTDKSSAVQTVASMALLWVATMVRSWVVDLALKTAVHSDKRSVAMWETQKAADSAFETAVP